MCYTELCKPGVHYITESIRLPSGTHLKAAPGTRLIGGVKLSVNVQHPDGVCECDLAAAQITPAGFVSRGFGRKISPSHSELFINGRSCNISQYPKRGSFLEITDVGETIKDEWNKSVGKLESGFFYKDEHVKLWSNDQEIWVHGYWAWDWAPTRERIDIFDKERGYIRNYPPYGQYTYAVGQRFYFFNIREEVIDPGDYCLDFSAGKLYFKPFDDTDIVHAEIILSTCDQPAFLIEDADDVTIEGFNIEAFRGNGIYINKSKHVEIRSCEIKNIGNRAIVVDETKNLRIVDCHIHNTGDSCISIWGGNRRTLEHAECVVEGCHLHHASGWDRCYEPPIHLTGVGLAARHNLIHDCPHTAILFSGNDISITDNEIYCVVQETGDAGAIYSGRDYTYRGNEVSRNFIHHVGGCVGVGTMGIYNDDCLSGTVMNGNVFYRVQRAVFLGGGVDIEVHGNIFIECTPSVEIDGRGQSDHKVWRKMICEILRERFYNIDGTGISAVEPPYVDRYPELLRIHDYYRLEAEPYIPPAVNITENYFCSERKIEHTWSTEGGTYIEKNNHDISYEELYGRLSPRQREVVFGKK